MSDRLALPRRYRDQLEALLRQHVPGVEVWAYGSRVNGESHEGSDLDLALRGPGLEPLDGGFYDLLEAIEKSDIPILVQAHDWAMLPESFHREIERDYIVVQQGAKQATGGWQEASLGEVIELKRGYDLPQRKRIPGSVPLVSSSGVTYYHTEAKVRGPGVVTGRYGTLGEVFFVPSDFWPLNTTLYVRDFKGNDPRFISYFLRGLDFSAYSDKAAVPGLNRNHLHQAAVRYPADITEQRGIAHVLGTLDDKIELNRRMNETLEAMARALFKSWFVDFEPVRAKMEGRWRPGESLPGLPADLYDLFPDRLVDSELGEVPDGWEVKALGSFGEIVTGKTPSTREPAYFGDDVPFLRIPDMHRNMYVLQTDMMLSTLGADSQPGKTLPPGSVSVSCIATPGLVVLNHRHTQTNQQINTIVPRDQPISRYLYWVCSHLSKDIETGGLGGSVLGNMNKSSFSALLVLNPEAAVLRAFDELASPLHTMILATEEQSQTLTQERDTLLPRLVSGEVRVGTE